MDRFKFRVWNNRSWDSDDFGKVYYDAEKTYDFIEGNPNIPASSFGNLVESDEWIIEQCTGLKDKNGKLIYEGDYIKNGNVIHRICWDNEEARFVARNKVYSFNIDICQNWIYDRKFEIIGNIHENKDLLEANND